MNYKLLIDLGIPAFIAAVVTGYMNHKQSQSLENHKIELQKQTTKHDKCIEALERLHTKLSPLCMQIYHLSQIAELEHRMPNNEELRVLYPIIQDYMTDSMSCGMYLPKSTTSILEELDDSILYMWGYCSVGEACCTNESTIRDFASMLRKIPQCIDNLQKALQSVFGLTE